MTYEFYLDVFWVTNFVMDFFALAAARCLKKGHGPLYRLALASAFGSTGSALLFLMLRHYVLYQVLIYLLINPLMIFIGWRIGSVREFFKDYLLVYLVMWLLGGIMNWGGNTITGSRYFWLWALLGCGICMIVLHLLDARREENLICDILLQTPEQNLSLKGFVDTGNLLMDPLVNQPVHIIREDVLESELKKEELSIRYIPYHSLGQEQGLLPVVTLKGMYISKAGNKKAEAPKYVEKPVFGMTKEKLFQNRDYQVIVNARCI